ncbi:TPA: hypothetical protein ACWCGG_005261, partial [Escherichia coli]
TAVNDFMDSVHHIWCPLFSQEFQDLPDGAETTLTVTPKLNGVAGPAFQVIKDSLTLGLNALTLTDVTKNAAYGVEIESLVLEINAPAA